MQARMKNPALVLPEAMKTLLALGAISHKTGLPKTTLLMVYLRASQINGCSLCVAMHSREMKQAGETDDRIYSVAAWREAPWFSDAERAALALTETTTRLADKEDAVPDPIWDEARKHYDDEKLSGLILAIASINVWNRLNAATRQVAGSFG
ncbi:MAG: 4-carboxymuconolactone decarboxylase domain/alkylhydroperoxidase AhpD family core domain protein [Reyranella sp.]|nr:4-carboxymuconolactone decarboxylase domain/alkylhydroperoxidase AhpD family core domain protein [Reyranella sp.]